MYVKKILFSLVFIRECGYQKPADTQAVSNCFYFLVLFDNYLCVPLPIMYFTLILLSDMTADVTDCKKQFLWCLRGVCFCCFVCANVQIKLFRMIFQEEDMHYFENYIVVPTDLIYSQIDLTSRILFPCLQIFQR